MVTAGALGSTECSSEACASAAYRFQCQPEGKTGQMDHRWVPWNYSHAMRKSNSYGLWQWLDYIGNCNNGLNSYMVNIVTAVVTNLTILWSNLRVIYSNNNDNALQTFGQCGNKNSSTTNNIQQLPERQPKQQQHQQQLKKQMHNNQQYQWIDRIPRSLLGTIVIRAEKLGICGGKLHAVGRKSDAKRHFCLKRLCMCLWPQFSDLPRCALYRHIEPKSAGDEACDHVTLNGVTKRDHQLG